MGSSPRLVVQNFDLIQQVNAQDVTILVAGRNVTMALPIARRGYVLHKKSRLIRRDFSVRERRADFVALRNSYRRIVLNAARASGQEFKGLKG
jgi:hypothetical protein